MTNIKVSVVIPVYNVEKYLEECLDSIVNQTLRETEIICVNDGSTDGSPEILQKYAAKDDRIIICTQENRGPSAARNKGAAQARGKYLYFMDSDDILELSALETLYEKAEADNLDVVRFNGDRFTDDAEYKKLLRLRGIHLIHKFNYEGICPGHVFLSEMMQHNDYHVAVWLQFINRSYYLDKNLAFYEGIVCEDYLFNYECILSASRVGYLSLQFYHYRMHRNSISSRGSTFATAYGHFICYLEMSRFYREHNIANFGDENLLVPVKLSLENFQYRYQLLPPEEKQKFLSLPNDQRQAFAACSPKKINRLPRNIQRCLHSLKKNGFIDTAKLAYWQIMHMR